MNNCVDDLIMHASDEAAARMYRLNNPGLTLETSGWAGYRVTFRNTIDDSSVRVFLSLLPQNYRGEKDGFSLTVQERQLAYDELEMYGVNVENFVIDSAEMFNWPFEAEKEVSPNAVSALSREGSETGRDFPAEKRSAASTERPQKENSSQSKVSSWLASHALEHPEI